MMPKPLYDGWIDACTHSISNNICAVCTCAHCYLLLFAIPCWWTSDDDQLQQLGAAAVARIMMLIPTAAKGKIILMHTHSDCAFDLNVDVIEVYLIERRHWPCKQWPRSACDYIDKYTISNNAMMRVEKPSLYLVPPHVTAAPAPNGIIKQRSWQQHQSYNKEDCCCCNNDNVELFPRTLELVDTGINRINVTEQQRNEWMNTWIVIRVYTLRYNTTSDWII